MKPITIIGGGLAGLTLGILLRRESVPVTIFEAGKYPRHRVCGEFLSGSGRKILREIGVEAKISKKREAATCAFHVPRRAPVQFTLRNPALCVSRYDLDAALAKEFQELGGQLQTGVRRDAENGEAGVVRATGRRRSEVSESRLFGLKAHAGEVPLGADLEMHFGENQYVGLCRLPDGRTNVCGLFHCTEAQPRLHALWRSVLASAVSTAALEKAAWDETSFCSVAALTLDRDTPPNLFCIGDSAAMIPPLTGNGMSMAFESALVAAPFMTKYAAGQLAWHECVQQHQQAWQNRFSSRLRWAAFLQRSMFQPAGQRLLLLGASIFSALPDLLFSNTR